MNIKVSRKYGEDNRFLEDVIIHEKSPDNKNRIVIKAKRGELKSARLIKNYNWSFLMKSL